MRQERRPRFVRIVNRTTKELFCMDDGMPEVIAPGYKAVPVLDEKGKPKTQKVKGQTLPVVEIVGANPDGTPFAQVVEYYAAERYKRQHPIMGTANPNSVDARDTDYLLGVLEWDDDIEHQEQSDSVELIDRSMLDDDKQVVKVLRLAGRKAIPTSVVLDRQEKANRRRIADSRYNNGQGNPFGMETRNGARW